jgi:hypothetical protein
MKHKISKKEKIKLRLEFFDGLVKEIRRRIELGDEIPNIIVKKQV